LKASLMLARKPKPKAVFPAKQSSVYQSRSSFKDPPAKCPDSTAGDSKPAES